jgi:hypothetical protein
MAIAIAGATHENRVFRGNGVVKKLDDSVDIGVVINPALGKESGECLKRGPGNALQSNMVGKEEKCRGGVDSQGTPEYTGISTQTREEDTGRVRR